MAANSFEEYSKTAKPRKRKDRNRSRSKDGSSGRKSKRKSNSEGSRDRDNRGRRDSRGKRDSRRRDGPIFTKVICASCGVECEVPFKPTSNKPILCNDCFTNKNNNSSNDITGSELKKIHEKLDKIMFALDIE